MEIDIVGILVFLWFIFKGLRQSQNAKQEHEQKQRERMGKTKPRSGPVIEKRPVVEEEKDIPTFNLSASVFPIPVELKLKNQTKTKEKGKPSQSLKKEVERGEKGR